MPKMLKILSPARNYPLGPHQRDSKLLVTGPPYFASYSNFIQIRLDPPQHKAQKRNNSWNKKTINKSSVLWLTSGQSQIESSIANEVKPGQTQKVGRQQLKSQTGTMATQVTACEKEGKKKNYESFTFSGYSFPICIQLCHWFTVHCIID